MLKELAQAIGQEKPKSETENRVRILEWSKAKLAAARIDQFLVIGAARQKVSEIVKLALARGEGGLGKSALYAEALKALEMQPMLTFVERPGELMASMRRSMRGSGERVPPQMGMAEWAIVGVDLDPKGVFMREAVKLDARGQQMMKALAANPLKPAIAQWLPKDSTMAVAGGAFGPVMKMTLEMWQQGQPEFASQIASVQQQLGLDFQRDLFDLLTGNWALVVGDLASVAQGQAPKMALIVESSPGGAPQVFDRLVATINKSAPGLAAVQAGQKRALMNLGAGPGGAVQASLEATPNVLAIGMPPAFVTALIQGLPEAKSLAAFLKEKQAPQKTEMIVYFNPASLTPVIGIAAATAGAGEGAQTAAKVIQGLGPMYGWSESPSKDRMYFEGRMAVDYKKLVALAEETAKQASGGKRTR